jgi:uncharacterized membrane protein YfcA
LTLPDSTLFTAAMQDHRFWVALGIVLLAGVVRGFSGFGSSLIYMPLAAAVYGPRIAAVTLLIFDTLGAAPFAIGACWQCNWREVLPIYIAAAIAVPFGTLALIYLDPTLLRWFMSILVLSLLGVLMSGWRYRGKPTLPVTIGVGLFSGFGGGAAQIAGPTVIIYWLGTKNNVITIRANLLAYFLLLGVTLCVDYYLQGLFTADLVSLSLLLAIPYFLATSVGARFFRGTSDLLYRRIAYLIIEVAGIISLPLLDPWLR